MKKALGILNRHFEEYALTFILGLIAVIMLLQVIMRYVFGYALAWPEEVCRYLYIWSCFLGISYCLYHGTELRIDLFERLFKGDARKIFQMVLKVICVLFYLYLLKASASVFLMVLQKSQISSAARIPMYLVYLSMPVSFTLAVVRGLQSMAEIIRSFRGHNGFMNEKRA